LLRDGAGTVEVLMVRRPETARFMPTAWVFPGGAVDPADVAAAAGAADPCLPWKLAALRELAEETGITLTRTGVTVRRGPTEGVDFDTDVLVHVANWITPEPLPLRFDTHFFAAPSPRGIEPEIDGYEVVDATWVTPDTALEHSRAGKWLVAFPTRNVLGRIGGHGTVADTLTALDDLPVERIMPRLRVDDARIEIVIPGEPGFDELGAEQRSPDLLDRMHETIRRGGVAPAEFRTR